MQQRGYCDLPPTTYPPLFRRGPYDFPERTMYQCECNDQLGKLRMNPMVQMTQAGVGPVASTAVGVGIGAMYGAAIGAVAGGSGRRGQGALYGAAAGASINLVLNALGIVFFTKD